MRSFLFLFPKGLVKCALTKWQEEWQMFIIMNVAWLPALILPPRPQPITAFHFYVSGKRFDVKRFTQPTYLHTRLFAHTNGWIYIQSPAQCVIFVVFFLPTARQQLCINDDPRFGKKKKFEITSRWITCDFSPWLHIKILETLLVFFFFFDSFLRNEEEKIQ